MGSIGEVAWMHNVVGIRRAPRALLPARREGGWVPLADPADLAAAEFVLLRHGETVYNAERRVNGDPSVPVELTEHGRAQARAIAPAIGAITWGSAWHTRFPRTRDTLALLLPDGRPVPQIIPELDDIDVGDLEGKTIEVWRAWRRGRGLDEAPPGGESRVDVLQRYARGFDRLGRRRRRCPRSWSATTRRSGISRTC